MLEYKGELYVGGAGGIERWNGNKWRGLGKGLSATMGIEHIVRVNTFAIYKDNLFVGGDFDTAGDKTAKCIAYWDGTKWSATGIGFTIDEDEGPGGAVACPRHSARSVTTPDT